MEFKGRILKELGVREGTSASTGRPWRIASYVLETIEQYPKRMSFEVSDGESGRIARLNIKEGKVMTIFFDISASEYQGRWYNRITCWDAREAEGQPQAQAAEQVKAVVMQSAPTPAPTPAPTAEAPAITTPQNDGLPF